MHDQQDQPSAAAELRSKAEALVAVATEDPELMSPEAIRHTLHELRVHQIELQMQNEELRRSQLKLDAARARYFDLYDLAPVGYCTLSESGLILEANLAAATLLGVRREALARQPLSRFIFKQDQDIFYVLRKSLFKTGAPQSGEMRMVRLDGATLWVQLDAALGQELAASSGLGAVGVPLCRVVLRDITARKQADEDLLQRNAELAALNADLDRFNRLAVGRETRIIELKQEVNELRRAAGQPAQYASEAAELLAQARAAPRPPD
jgi:PAS domain S-box-containing protein